MLYPPHLAPPGMMPYAPSSGGYAQSTLVRPPPHHHPHYPVAADRQYATDHQHRLAVQHQQRAVQQEKRARRSRRKSESDKAAEQRAVAAFTYTGLDRTIADSFLEHQQAKQTGSSSSPEGSSLHGGGRGGDVAM